jgi:hypothetical protein
MVSARTWSLLIALLLLCGGLGRTLTYDHSRVHGDPVLLAVEDLGETDQPLVAVQAHAPACSCSGVSIDVSLAKDVRVGRLRRDAPRAVLSAPRYALSCSCQVLVGGGTPASAAFNPPVARLSSHEEDDALRVHDFADRERQYASVIEMAARIIASFARNAGSARGDVSKRVH